MPTLLATTPVWRGDPLTITVTVKDSAGNPVNLTTYGSTFASQIRTSIDAATVTATFTVDATNAATGVLKLSLTGTQTAALKRTTDKGGNTSYGFDVQATDASGNNTTLVYGYLSVDGEWTHS